MEQHVFLVIIVGVIMFNSFPKELSNNQGFFLHKSGLLISQYLPNWCLNFTSVYLTCCVVSALTHPYCLQLLMVVCVKRRKAWLASARRGAFHHAPIKKLPLRAAQRKVWPGKLKGAVGLYVENTNYTIVLKINRRMEILCKVECHLIFWNNGCRCQSVQALQNKEKPEAFADSKGIIILSRRRVAKSGIFS